MALGILLMGGPFRIATFDSERDGRSCRPGCARDHGRSGRDRRDHDRSQLVQAAGAAWRWWLGWSDSSAGVRWLHPSRSTSQLLRLQATRMPFTVFTSRRMYPNMLMESITDPISAQDLHRSMLPRITFRELIISRTQTDQREHGEAPASNPADQANPESTGVCRRSRHRHSPRRSARRRSRVPTTQGLSQTPVGPGAYQSRWQRRRRVFSGLGVINTPGADIPLIAEPAT